MQTDAVLIYDSGVGGLAYLDALQKLGPTLPLVYYADSAFFPFGEKGAVLLEQHIGAKIIRLVERWNPQLLLLACNTASVVALESLRRTLEIPIVGTVPAVKVAAQTSARKRIALLATTGTIEAGYLDRLLAVHAGDCSVVKIAASSLVNFVEHHFIYSSEETIARELDQVLNKIVGAQVDKLVLGCTHFLHLRQDFQRLLPAEVELVDSLAGVSAQTLRLARPVHRPANPRTLLISNSSLPYWRQWADHYQLTFRFDAES